MERNTGGNNGKVSLFSEGGQQNTQQGKDTQRVGMLFHKLCNPPSELTILSSVPGSQLWELYPYSYVYFIHTGKHYEVLKNLSHMSKEFPPLRDAVVMGIVRLDMFRMRMYPSSYLFVTYPANANGNLSPSLNLVLSSDWVFYWLPRSSPFPHPVPTKDVLEYLHRVMLRVSTRLSRVPLVGEMVVLKMLGTVGVVVDKRGDDLIVVVELFKDREVLVRVPRSAVNRTYTLVDDMDVYEPLLEV